MFLKEPYINTNVYAEKRKDKIELQGTDEDEIFKGLNQYFKRLAEKQIRIAFEQAEKEKIQKYSKDFMGTLADAECMKLAGVARNTFYKYKREILQGIEE